MSERFTSESYFQVEGYEKKFLTRFICQADYTDELSFYKSLDYLYQQYAKAINSSLIEYLDKAKEDISKMGMEESKKVLLQIARK